MRSESSRCVSCKKIIEVSFFSHFLRSLPIVLSSLTLDDRPLQLTEIILGGPGLSSIPPLTRRATIERDYS